MNRQKQEPEPEPQYLMVLKMLHATDKLAGVQIEIFHGHSCARDGDGGVCDCEPVCIAHRVGSDVVPAWIQ